MLTDFHSPNAPAAITVGSLFSPRDCQLAAQSMKAGQAVGVFVRSVSNLWLDGSNALAAETVCQIKGQQRAGRPVTTVLSAAEFIELLDVQRIAPAWRALFLDAHELEVRLATLCLIRAPVRADLVRRWPPALVSHTPDGATWLQNWLPDRPHPLCLFLDSLHAQGVHLPVVTSLNVSGQPEIVDQAEAVQFCAAQHIPYFLSNPAGPSVARGSFPILGIDERGVRLLRDGHFPGWVFQYLLGASIELADVRPAKFPLLEVPDDICPDQLAAPELRRKLMDWLNGNLLTV